MSAALVVVVVLLVVLAAGTLLFLRSRGKRAPSRPEAFLRSLSGLVRGADDREAARLLETRRGGRRGLVERA